MSRNPLASLTNTIGRPSLGAPQRRKNTRRMTFASDHPKPPRRSAIHSRRGGRRATLVPPQQRRSTLLPSHPRARASIGRRSSIYSAGGRSGPKKDHRPLKDRAWQKETVSRIVLFAIERDYDRKMEGKQWLRGPPAKEVHCLVEFLLRRIDPEFSFGGSKPEVVIPLLFKRLSYPFVISKSMLISVAPHTWPVLLGALDWLVDLVCVCFELFLGVCFNLGFF